MPANSGFDPSLCLLWRGEVPMGTGKPSSFSNPRILTARILTVWTDLSNTLARAPPHPSLHREWAMLYDDAVLDGALG